MATQIAKEGFYDLRILRDTVVNGKNVFKGDIVKDVSYQDAMILLGKPNNKACEVTSTEDENFKEKKAKKARSKVTKEDDK